MTDAGRDSDDKVVAPRRPRARRSSRSSGDVAAAEERGFSLFRK